MAFNDAMLRAALKMLPKSWIDGVPQLVVSAVRKKLEKVQHAGNTMPVIMILPDADDPNDCAIGVCVVPVNMEVDIIERYSGKEFVQSLIKEADNG